MTYPPRCEKHPWAEMYEPRNDPGPADWHCRACGLEADNERLREEVEIERIGHNTQCEPRISDLEADNERLRSQVSRLSGESPVRLREALAENERLGKERDAALRAAENCFQRHERLREAIFDYVKAIRRADLSNEFDPYIENLVAALDQPTTEESEKRRRWTIAIEFGDPDTAIVVPRGAPRLAGFAYYEVEEVATKPTTEQFPRREGGLTIIGPECFTDGTVISYRGENYERQTRLRDARGALRALVEGIDHETIVPEDEPLRTALREARRLTADKA